MTPRARGSLCVFVATSLTSLSLWALSAPAYSAPPDQPGNHQGQGPGSGQGNGTGTGDGNGQPDQNGTGQGDQTKPDKPKEKPKPPPDKTAPAAPALGTVAVEPKGVVKLPIRAEDGSQILVKEHQQVIAEGRGTGQPKTFTWTARNGTHHYAVTATDKAGNRSAPAKVDVKVDSKAPKVQSFKVRAGDSSDSRSVVTFAADAGASYTLLVDDKSVADGTAGKKPIRKVLDLPDGTHKLALEVSDEVGNTRTADREVKIKIPSLDVSASIDTEATDPSQIVSVETTPNTKSAALRIPGEESETIKLKNGSGKLSFAVPDGTYDDAKVVVHDTQGRTGSKTLPEFSVDTTPPELTVVGDDASANKGQLQFTVTTDKGALVTWALVEPSGQQVASGRYAASGEAQTITRDVGKGSYQLKVDSTDLYDRTTTQEMSAKIASDPWPLWLLPVVVAVGVALAGVVLLLIVRLWRRASVGLRKRREARQLKRGYTPRRLQLAEYKEAERQWRHRYDALSTLLRVADSGVNGLLALMPGVTLASDEKLLFTTQALLIDTTADGNTMQAKDHGELVVTNNRFAFAGEQHRDWWCSHIEDMQHEGNDVTMIKVSDSDSWSGFSYADPEVTRLYLDLAWAEQRGEREEYVASVSRGLRDLELSKPSRPNRR